MTDPSGLRVAVVIEAFDPHGGGNERSTAQTVAGLTARGHTVTVVTAAASVDAAAWTDRHGAGLREIGPGRLRTARRLRAFARRAAAYAGGGSFDVGLSVTTAVPADVLQPRGGTAAEARRRNAARRGGGRAAGLMDLAGGLNRKRAVLRRLEACTLTDPRVRKIVAISDYVTRQLREHHAVDPRRVVRIDNAAVSPRRGLDDGAWTRLRAEHRLRWGLTPEDTALLFAAYNPALKGFDELLAAFARLNADPPASAPVLLLAGPLNRARARAAARVGGAAVVPLGALRDPAAAFAACDAVVLSTWYDPCSRVVLEGLMVGRPAVTTAYNGAADVVCPPGGPARGAVVRDPADGPALTAALRAACNPPRRASWARAAAGLEDRLGMSRHVGELEAVLRAAAAERAAAGRRPG